MCKDEWKTRHLSFVPEHTKQGTRTQLSKSTKWRHGPAASTFLKGSNRNDPLVFQARNMWISNELRAERESLRTLLDAEAETDSEFREQLRKMDDVYKQNDEFANSLNSSEDFHNKHRYWPLVTSKATMISVIEERREFYRDFEQKARSRGNTNLFNVHDNTEYIVSCGVDAIIGVVPSRLSKWPGHCLRYIMSAGGTIWSKGHPLLEMLRIPEAEVKWYTTIVEGYSLKPSPGTVDWDSDEECCACCGGDAGGGVGRAVPGTIREDSRKDFLEAW